MTINPNRPLEELRGDNRGIVRQILGRTHCMTSIRDQLKAARPNNLRRVPIALRRGWVLCVLETVAEYRSTYIGVTRGQLSYQAPVKRRD